MPEYDRKWLRSFLTLGAMAGTTVPGGDIERQEDTVLRALRLLDEQPGIVLADEVGMGKTYEALGVVAARLHARPNARVLILTPGHDLNDKWIKELRAFCDTGRTIYGGFDKAFVEAGTLAELVGKLKDSSIVVAPVNVFAGSRALADQAFLLSLWASDQGLTGNMPAALFRRYRNGTASRVDFENATFLDVFDWKALKRPAREALRAHRKWGDRSLYALWEAGGYEAFSNQNAVDAALTDLRFRIIGGLVPDLDLLVIDEAHKLKNADTVRATGVRTVFEGRFDKALFLTATPFQLTVDELSQVFKLFALARSAPTDMGERSERLLSVVRDYTAAYDEFDRVWARLDGAGAADFKAFYEADPALATEPDDPTLRVVVARARRLLALKRDHVEPGFRSWMIRSLRVDKRVYRKTLRERLRHNSGLGVPFLLYERFIAELFRSHARTHKAAVQINMVSSFGAARVGALLADEVKSGLDGDAEAYRQLLQRVVGELRDENGGHPKVDFVVRDALAAAERNEKTLIFCTRIETLRELKRNIEASWDERMLTSWQRVFPGASKSDIFDQAADGADSRGRHSRLQTRFQRGQDALYIALRERYVPTLLGASQFAHEHIDAIVRRSNDILSLQHVGKTDAERTDWSLLKRCVEQATAHELRDAGLAGDVDPDAMRRLLDPSFIALGFDLVADDVEAASVGPRTPEWTIDASDALLVITPVHLWSHLTGPLYDVPADLRVRTVERLAAYLVSRYVPFLADLLAYARSEGIDVERIESRALLPVTDRFWTTAAGRPWCDLLRSFLTYAAPLDEARRREVLDDVVKAGAIVRHTVEGESRERLREAFNTPLYPMILVANEVMQEGLDLHHHCRRVVHHDLAWNPAQLEQRVGRVDRLGSLVQRLRARAPDTTLDILMPLISNTIDERLERTVRVRERWLEFLLGAAPKIEEYGLADAPAQPLPEAFAASLKVELGP